MLLADENIPKFLVDALKKKGIDVLWITETNYRESNDFQIVELAVKENRTILTKDKDFLLPSLKQRAVIIGVIHIAMPITLENYNEVLGDILFALRSSKGHIVSISGENILRY